MGGFQQKLSGSSNFQPYRLSKTSWNLRFSRSVDDRMLNEYGAVGGMIIGRRNRNTRRKPAPMPLCPPQIPQDLTWDQIRLAAMDSWRLPAWAMARSVKMVSIFLMIRVILIPYISNLLGKGKFVPLLNYLSTMPWRRMGEWKYSATILDLSTGWRWVVSFTYRPLYPRGKNPRCPLDRRLGGPQSRSGLWGEEKNLLPLSEIGPRPSSP
jgi:hypothetical protein